MRKPFLETCPCCGFEGVLVAKSGQYAIAYCACCQHPRFIAVKREVAL